MRQIPCELPRARDRQESVRDLSFCAVLDVNKNDGSGRRFVDGLHCRGDRNFNDQVIFRHLEFFSASLFKSRDDGAINGFHVVFVVKCSFNHRFDDFDSGRFGRGDVASVHGLVMGGDADRIPLRSR